MAFLKALQVPCPVCGVKPHKQCKSVSMNGAGKPLGFEIVHQSRIQAAFRADEPKPGGPRQAKLLAFR